MDSANVEKGLELIGQEIRENLAKEIKNDESVMSESDMKLEPLDKEEIEIALTKIDDLHPLYRMPVIEVLPYLCYPCRKSKRNKKAAVEEQAPLVSENSRRDSLIMLQEEIMDTDNRLNNIISNKAKAKEYEGTNFVQDELESKMEIMNQFNNPKAENDSDPFNGFGFGITAYFKMLRYLIFTYALMSVLAFGTIFLYANGNTIQVENFKDAMGFITLGNLGFSQSKCLMWYKDLDKDQTLRCSRGKISKVINRGIVPDISNFKFVNGTTVPSDYCGVVDQFPSEYDCSSLFPASFDTAFDDACKDKATCRFNANTFVKDTGKNPKCVTGNPKIFIQYECVMDEQSTKDVQLVGLTVIQLSIMMTIIFLAVIYYLKATTNLDFKAWDIDTTTASDFTVQMPITPGMWAWF